MSWRVLVFFDEGDKKRLLAKDREEANKLKEWWEGRDGCKKVLVVPPMDKLIGKKKVVRAEERDHIITKDEITNLKITLNTIDDFDELLAVL